MAEGVEGRRRQRLAAAVPRACSPMLARYPAPAVTVSKFRYFFLPLNCFSMELDSLYIHGWPTVCVNRSRLMQGAVNSSSDSVMVGLMYHPEAIAVKNDELQVEQEVRTLKVLSLVQKENELAILVAVLLFATVAADAT